MKYFAKISPFEKILLRTYITLLFLLQGTLMSFAVKAYQPVIEDPLEQSWRWQSFPDLCGVDVRCMTEDAFGNMWFGIRGGVVKYNGYNWSKYSSKNGFYDVVVDRLLTAKDKSIYAASKSGLFALRNKLWKKLYPTSSDKQIASVNCVYELRDGTLLAGVGKAQSKYSALLLIAKNKQIIYCSPAAKSFYSKEFQGSDIKLISDNFLVNGHFSISAIYQDKQNRIWFTVVEPKFSGLVISSNSPTNGQLNLFQTSTVYTEKDGVILGRHAIISQLHDGSIWILNIESDKCGIVFNNNAWKRLKLSDVVGKDEVHTSIIETPTDGLWIGGFGVLYVKQNNHWKTFKRPDFPIPNTRVLLYKDSKGSIWILGYRYEVIKVDNSDTKWKTYNYLNYQCTSKDRRTWFISVDDRVIVQNGQHWYSYGKEDGLPDSPSRIFISRNGRIWVTGSDNSIATTAFYDGRVWHKFTHPFLSWSIDSRAVFEDSKGQMWFGGSTNIVKEKGQKGGVVCLLNPSSLSPIWKYYYSSDKLEFRNAYGIAESKDHRIWTGGTMLRSFYKGKWSGIDDPDQANMIDIVKNRLNGNLWVGTRVLGLKSFDGKIWHTYDINNGLISNSIIDVLIKSDSNLWVATDKDFSHYDGKAWTNNVFPKDLTLIREAGGLVDGTDGCLWINKSSFEWRRRALLHNFLDAEMKESFKTYCYRLDRKAPETKVLKYQEDIAYPGTSNFVWAGEDAWNNTSENRLSYSYRINDGEWSPFREKTSETFAKLPSGTNTLEVRARDLDFNIDPTPAKIEFYVDYPVWRKLWFITLITLFIIVILVYRQRLERRNQYLSEAKSQLEHQNEEILMQKEKILKIAQREQESNQSRIRFFTNISHEFRTPLTLILSSLDRVSSMDVEKEKSSLEKYLAIMQRNSQQLLRLINQLMDFRKADTNNMQLKVTQANVVENIENIIASFQSQVEVHKLKLVFEKDVDNLNVWIDRDKIEKILYNLISNAIKFTPENGQIRVLLKVLPEENKYQIQVDDTGVGIPKAEIQHIIEPFYQANNKAVRNEMGTGIGLSLVNSLVKAHAGTIDIVSQKQEEPIDITKYNTSFIVTLPLGDDFFEKDEILNEEESVDLVEDKPNTYEVLDGTKPRILVVDDNDDIRELIIDTLGEKYEFVEAENGKIAFEKALEFLPSLIISDVMMPEVNGIEFCRNVKTDEQISHIPVILLTANDGEEQLIEGYETGANEYITKPFNAKILVLKVRNILESRALLRKKYKTEVDAKPQSVVSNPLDVAFMEKVQTVVEQNIKEEDFDVEALSKALCVSVRQLHNKLTALTDMSPGEFIRVYKLKKAAEALLTRQTNISEVAYEFGFSNPKYFTKTFRQQFGISPKEYIEQHS